MVYDWAAHKDTCYRLYIGERKPLDDIMVYMRVHHKFAPSKRAYQTQFRRWNFPPKQNPAYKNVELVDRIRELWERNLPQREMLRCLHDEGFDINARELMRVRTRNRWLLRVPNQGDGGKSSTPDMQSSGVDQDDDDEEEEEEEEEEDDEVDDTDDGVDHAGSPLLNLDHALLKGDVHSLGYGSQLGSPLGMGDPVAAKKQERQRRMEADSEERWVAKKRRRRTRAWAGLPADPPGPPRFPSETTLEQSKDRLELGKTLYQDIRTRFREICNESGVAKKTEAGPERWDAAKEALIEEFPHLQARLRGEQEDLDSKQLALDVLCSDVTKRMRATEVRITIAEAKNIIGVNPQQSREIRAAFYKILQEDQFTSKLEAGPEHWQELKAQWFAGSPLLQGLLASGDEDPQHEEKATAIDALAKDVMKRLRDDQTRRNPGRQKMTPEKLPPTTIELNMAGLENLNDENALDIDYLPQHTPLSLMPGTPNNQMQVHVNTHLQPSPQQLQEHSPQLHTQPPPTLFQGPVIDVQTGLTLDPQLSSSLLGLAADAQASFVDPQFGVSQFDATHVFHHHHHHHHAPPPNPNRIVAYFRAHPNSPYMTQEPMWVSELNEPGSLEELRHVAVDKLPNAVCGTVQGLVTNSDGGAGLELLITSGDELRAYLTMQFTRGSPTFVVYLDFWAPP